LVYNIIQAIVSNRVAIYDYFLGINLQIMLSKSLLIVLLCQNI